MKRKEKKLRNGLRKNISEIHKNNSKQGKQFKSKQEKTLQESVIERK